jgi:hypothetical protein
MIFLFKFMLHIANQMMSIANYKRSRIKYLMKCPRNRPKKYHLSKTLKN